MDRRFPEARAMAGKSVRGVMCNKEHNDQKTGCTPVPSGVYVKITTFVLTTKKLFAQQISLRTACAELGQGHDKGEEQQEPT